MRLLLAGNHLSSNGGSRGPIEDLSERLRSRGYECICTSTYRNGLVRAGDLLWTAVNRRGDFDAAIVDVYSGRAFLWAHALSRVLQRLGKPFVLALHGGALPEYAAWHSGAVRDCLRRAAAVTAPSGYLREGMRAYCPGIRVIPNPLDLDALPYRTRSSASPSIVWVRAFHRIYNPLLAVRVLREVLRQVPEATLTMVGGDKDGSLRQTTDEAKRLGVLDRIFIAGKQPYAQVARYLDSGDIFINTTNIDNTPVSVLEAMACGLCVVSTRVGGVPWVIGHEDNGLMVPPDNELAMAEAVVRIVRDPLLATRLSISARGSAQQSGWPEVLPKWEGLLAEITRGPGAEVRVIRAAARRQLR
jgi:glycosyltransferase involved in cell wall biosynthesis